MAGRQEIDVAVLVGTCSWTDKTLVACGRFYPKGCSSAEGRLRHYASQFPLVEVDSSYYAMPSRENSELWVERTPARFTFNIKAFRLFTSHRTAVRALPRDIAAALGLDPATHVYYDDVPAELRDELWRRFHEAIEPLDAASKLCLVHFQFPPWLTRNRAGHDHVRHCVEKMDGRAVSVEFRNRIWFEGAHAASTLAFERELGVVHTVVDAPQGFANSVPAIWEATHPELALVRLHGRNSATWNLAGLHAASDRFNYDYPQAELAALATRIETLARNGFETHVVFNNNMEDQGQRNARSLIGELESSMSTTRHAMRAESALSSALTA
jgi:uncharacterized protein YecE (DUF72 family)